MLLRVLDWHVGCRRAATGSFFSCAIDSSETHATSDVPASALAGFWGPRSPKSHRDRRRCLVAGLSRDL
eukprot:6559284-Pyramimonas_sp.AAC.1